MTAEKIIERIQHLSRQQLAAVLKFLEQLPDLKENQISEEAPASEDSGRDQ